MEYRQGMYLGRICSSLPVAYHEVDEHADAPRVTGNPACHLSLSVIRQSNVLTSGRLAHDVYSLHE